MQPSRPPTLRQPHAIVPEERPRERGRASADVCTLVWTPVWTVKVAVAALVPLGVTVLGLMLQLEFFGAPEQDRLTG